MGFRLRDQRGPVVGADFGGAETAGPGAHGRFGAGEEAQTGFGGADGGAGGGGGGGGEVGGGLFVEAGEEDGDDEEGGFFGDLDAQGGG